MVCEFKDIPLIINYNAFLNETKILREINHIR